MLFWNSLAFSTNQQMLAIWSVSSAFSKSSLNLWKFMVHILLKPSSKDFEHYLDSMWNECNCTVVWTFLAFFEVGIKSDLFQSCGHCRVFQICWHTECSTFTASSFRIWNSSTGTPSPPLALFIVMLPKAHLTSDSPGSKWVITPLWFLGHEDLFCIVLLYILAISSEYHLLLLGPYHFCPLSRPSLHKMFPWYL